MKAYTAALIALAIVGILASIFVPCRYLGWVAVKELPTRCLTRSP